MVMRSAMACAKGSSVQFRWEPLSHDAHIEIEAAHEVALLLLKLVLEPHLLGLHARDAPKVKTMLSRDVCTASLSSRIGLANRQAQTLQGIMQRAKFTAGVSCKPQPEQVRA